MHGSRVILSFFFFFLWEFRALLRIRHVASNRGTLFIVATKIKEEKKSSEKKKPCSLIDCVIDKGTLSYRKKASPEQRALQPAHFWITVYEITINQYFIFRGLRSLTTYKLQRCASTTAGKEKKTQKTKHTGSIPLQSKTKVATK